MQTGTESRRLLTLTIFCWCKDWWIGTSNSHKHVPMILGKVSCKGFGWLVICSVFVHALSVKPMIFSYDLLCKVFMRNTQKWDECSCLSTWILKELQPIGSANTKVQRALLDHWIHIYQLEIILFYIYMSIPNHWLVLVHLVMMWDAKLDILYA
jgi:hypothetical protein